MISIVCIFDRILIVVVSLQNHELKVKEYEIDERED